MYSVIRKKEQKKEKIFNLLMWIQQIDVHFLLSIQTVHFYLISLWIFLHF